MVVRNTQLKLREEKGMAEVAGLWRDLYMMEILAYDLYNRATDVLREVGEEGGRGYEVNQIW